MTTIRKLASHTPGPWFEGERHESMVKIEPYICIVRGAMASTSEVNANARLIAAAPDLLAACEFIVHALQRVDDYDAQTRAEQQALVAIKKARGE